MTERSGEVEMAVIIIYHTGALDGAPGLRQGYRIWSDSLAMGLVLADSHDRIRNSATNAAALWLLESGISARRPEKNPYAIALGFAPILMTSPPAVAKRIRNQPEMNRPNAP